MQPHEAWLQRSCVQEAVVHQLQHDPVQAVMTAVGNCYVSVLFRSLQEWKMLCSFGFFNALLSLDHKLVRH